MSSAPAVIRFDEIEQRPDDAVTAHSHFTPTEPVLRELVDELFAKNWFRITVGPCMEGAVFEIRFVQAPEIRISDGYLTVDLGPWHFQPTANLDIQHALEVLNLCQRLSRKAKTIIVATHDFNLVMRYVSRSVLLQDGKLMAQGTRDEVLHPRTIQEVFQVDAELVQTKSGDPLYMFHSREAS